MSWWELLVEAFSYGFMQRALIVGIAVAVSSSMIGAFLVLKKYSMVGHGLSHVAFAAIAIGLVLNQSPLLVTAPVVVIVSVFILHINERAKIHGDAAIGLTAAFSMALGTTLASIGGGFNVDLFSYLFGSILTIQHIDVVLSVVLSFIVVIVVILFYNDFVSMTYDEAFSRVTGIKTRRLNTVLAVLTGLTVVVGIRAIGTVLISALIIFPTITALQFSRGFKATIMLAVLLSVATVITGLIGSFFLDLPSGSAIVLLNGIVFMVIFSYNLVVRR